MRRTKIIIAWCCCSSVLPSKRDNVIKHMYVDSCTTPLECVGNSSYSKFNIYYFVALSAMHKMEQIISASQPIKL